VTSNVTHLARDMEMESVAQRVETLEHLLIIEVKRGSVSFRFVFILCEITLLWFHLCAACFFLSLFVSYNKCLICHFLASFD
jgi:hypothetical protein